ncbi:hypothetical protein ACI2LF_36185 [Kribbella sp. NPDC020789]
MQYYRPTWLEQDALKGSRWARRALCRKVRRTSDRRAFFMAARILYAEPTDEARDDVLRVFGEWRDRDFQARVLYGLEEASDTGERERHRPIPDVPSSVTSFLLAGDRIQEYFDGAEPAFPRPSGTGHRDLAQWLVDAALHSSDPQARADLARLLTETGHPDLLDRLRVAFWEALENEKGRDASKVRLWDDGSPTELTRIVLANPHFPLPLTEKEQGAGGTYTHAPGVIVAVLKNRLDRVEDYLGPRFAPAAVGELLTALDLPGPADLADRCRRVLRELPPGIARERLVQEAILGRPEAIAAAADAGYAPAEERDALAFLYITRQWDRYDDADPDGSKLTAYCAEHARVYAGTYRHQIEHAAQVSGRPNPCPVLPKPDPSTRTDPPRPSIGSWPTSFTGGSW